ncbi:MAG: Helix-turn-helix protein [Cyanobacteriota bacterium erpe_2018_sw_39hr_WHONDRS-SW48-000098_B_bin.30]|jgi:cytoskeletal protein RodZ|nr:Helix-turn-helix protein [Cyanobacteriota bacterium erpe_2018_sw_39hr_WHONDRS-SW48-000098_B_bin.30]
MSLEQIGQKLKSAREMQGLSLGQVYDRTKIPMSSLEAIETGRGDDLPEPVYVAGFIKRYGDMLGLSGQALADEYKKAGQSMDNARSGLFGMGKGGGREVPPAPMTYVTKSRVESEAPSFTRTFFYPSLLLVAVLASVCGLIAWNQSQLNSQDPGVLALRDSATRYNAAGNQVPVQPNQLPAANVATTQAAPVEAKVALSATQHVWVEVKAVSSGASLFTGYLESGDKKEYTDPQGVTVRAGNGGSLTVENQGKSEVFGAPGKVREFTYMAPVPQVTQVATDTTGQSATTPVKPVTNVKRPVVRRTTGETGSSPVRRPRRVDDGGTRDIPGATGGRSIDVPYRYNDGRLDND